MSRYFQFLVPLAATLWAAGCATPSSQEPQTYATIAQRLERSVDSFRAREQPHLAGLDLERALRLYALMDDQVGQARVHLKLVRLYARQGNTELTKLHLQRAGRISGRINDKDIAFDTALLSARFSQRPADFEHALSLARIPIQKAVSLAYLGRHQEAWSLIQGLEPTPDIRMDLAFVSLGMARDSHQPSVALRALDLFKQAGSAEGIALCLELLTELYLATGDTARASGLRDRARVVRRALQAARQPVSTP